MKIENALFALAFVLIGVVVYGYMSDRARDPDVVLKTVQIEPIVPPNIVVAQEAPLILKLTNTNSTDVRIVGMNWC